MSAQNPAAFTLDIGHNERFVLYSRIFRQRGLATEKTRREGMMRFKLSTLFWAIGITAGFCATVFIAPLAVTFFLLSFTMAISPAVWLTGLAFARGAKKAFFIGGTSSAFIPHIIAMYYIYAMLLGSIISEIEVGGWMQLGINEPGEALVYRITMAVCWLTPGGFAVSGGSLAVLTYRKVVDVALNATETKVVQDPVMEQPLPVPSRVVDRQVIAGRLETVSFDEAHS